MKLHRFEYCVINIDNMDSASILDNMSIRIVFSSGNSVELSFENEAEAKQALNNLYLGRC